MVTAWRFYIERNSIQSPCNTPCSRVTYKVNEITTLRLFGGYSVSWTDTEIMNYILTPSLSWDSYQYQASDPVYLNNAYFKGNQIVKELVTNFDIPLNLLEVLYGQLPIIYREGIYFIYSFNNPVESVYTQVGAGFALIAQNSITGSIIAWMLVGGNDIVWFWRTQVGKTALEGDLSAETMKKIAEINADPTKTPEQKKAEIENLIKQPDAIVNKTIANDNFTITADKQKGNGNSYTATIKVNYPPGAGKLIGFQNPGSILVDCINKITLDQYGKGETTLEITKDQTWLATTTDCCRLNLPGCVYSNKLNFSIGGTNWKTLALYGGGALLAVYLYTESRKKTPIWKRNQ